MVQNNFSNSVDNVPNVLGAGLLCLDIIKKGGKRKYLNGGSCGNVVSALSFLGWGASIITQQYRDLAGDILNKNLERLRVNRIEIGRTTYTPRIIEEVLPLSNNFDHKFLLHCPDCRKKLPSVKPLSEKTVKHLVKSLEGYNVYYTDRTSLGIQFLRSCLNKQGAWIVYEPNSSRNIHSLLKNSLESHIVKFSSEKVSRSVAEKIKDLAIQGITTLIVRTAGKEGLYFCYRKRGNKMSDWFHLESQPVADFVDSSGAGDWCTTGLLFNIVNRHRKSRLWFTKDEVVAALQYGQALSAISCSFTGAMGVIYTQNVENIQNVVRGDNRLLPNLEPVIPSSNRLNDCCNTCLLPFNH